MDLSGKAAMLCLVRFHQKAYKKNTRKKKGGSKHPIITNQGEIVFTYSEAKELGIKSSRTFCRVIKELVEDKGFIDISEVGNWYLRQPTKFSISYRWKHYGTDGYIQPENKNTLYLSKANRLYQDKAKTDFKKNL